MIERAKKMAGLTVEKITIKIKFPPAKETDAIPPESGDDMTSTRDEKSKEKPKEVVGAKTEEKDEEDEDEEEEFWKWKTEQARWMERRRKNLSLKRWQKRIAKPKGANWRKVLQERLSL
jgi:hypothetical protein